MLIGYVTRSDEETSLSTIPIVGTPIYNASFKATCWPLIEKKKRTSGLPHSGIKPFKFLKRRAFFGFIFGQIKLLSSKARSKNVLKEV
jgi:hypothetical protein